MKLGRHDGGKFVAKPPKDKLGLLIYGSDAMRVAIKDPAFATRMAELGAEQIADARQTPEGLKTFLGSEITKWGGVIKAAGQFAD